MFTHWGWVKHICVSNPTMIGSDNGLSPSRCQAIIGTNAGILLIRPLGTNFSEMLIKIHILSFKKMHFKWSSGKWQPFCPGLNVLKRMGEAFTAVNEIFKLEPWPTYTWIYDGYTYVFCCTWVVKGNSMLSFKQAHIKLFCVFITFLWKASVDYLGIWNKMSSMRPVWSPWWTI